MNNKSRPEQKLQFWYRKKLPVITQSEGTECGLACLAMVASYHGHHIDLISLRKKFFISMEGATLHDIMQFSEELSLTTRPLKIELDDLVSMKTPCILHWDLNHFVVLKSANANSIIIHDPASGIKKYTLEKASAHFTGIALELLPTKNFKLKKKTESIKLSSFWTKVTGLKRSVALILTLSILLQIFTLASPYYIQLVIDDVILTADTSLLVVLALGFSFVLMFEVISNALRGFSLLHFGNLMSMQLGANLFHHLIRLPLDYFQKRHIGDVVSRFSSMQNVKELLTTGVIETIIDGFMALITLSMICYYSPQLTFVVVLAVLLYGLSRLAMYKPFKEVSEQEIIALAEENTNFMETVKGIQTIKLYGSEVDRESIWQNHFSNAINKNIRLGHYQISYTALNRILFGLENVIVIYLAAHLVIEGGFSTGMLFAFMAYKTQFMTNMSKLIDKFIEFRMLGLHMDRIADITLTEKEPLNPDKTRAHTIAGKISVCDLSFKYSDISEEILSNINLEILPNESVVITGPSGCGKSTLLKLMLGLIKPVTGQVFIDDIPIEKIGNQQYRKQVAAVMQNDELLSGSIAENIAFFNKRIDMERVIECAKLASVHNDISKMPMAYESLIGGMGSSLSGGQKQRLILARALYKKPKILFMDEATSHLDSELEKDINSAIRQLNITRVIIAHRIETIKSADREIALVHHYGI